MFTPPPKLWARGVGVWLPPPHMRAHVCSHCMVYVRRARLRRCSRSTNRDFFRETSRFQELNVLTLGGCSYVDELRHTRSSLVRVCDVFEEGLDGHLLQYSVPSGRHLWGACAVLDQTDGLCYSVCPIYALCAAFEFGGNVIDVLL